MVNGLDALHQGVEMEISQRVGDVLTIGGIFSLGNWQWKNDVTALLYNNENVVVDTIDVYANGLFVGDAPQTQLGLFGSVRVFKMFRVSAQWNYYDRMYADFNPANRTDPDDRSQPYRLPSYHALDLHLEFPFKAGNIEFLAYGSAFNLLNDEYIIRAVDGPSHDRETMTGFWGLGRNFNFGIKVAF
jgi:hypothetical protein